MDLGKITENTKARLSLNRYPGRGIIIGQTKDGENLVQVYWIMGRSSNSRNRVFEVEGNSIKTKAYDEKKVEDPSLIIYYPIKEINGSHIVTNGDQTDTIFQYLSAGKSFEDALKTRTFEPDPPHFTPRISGIINVELDKPNYSLAILKSFNNDESVCCRQFFDYGAFKRGFGHCIHTYMGDVNPLPSFGGEPFVVQIFDGLDETAEYYWNLLDAENRISMVVKFISSKTGNSRLKIINKNS